jgi:hypothetical protein
MDNKLIGPSGSDCDERKLTSAPCLHGTPLYIHGLILAFEVPAMYIIVII